MIVLVCFMMLTMAAARRPGEPVPANTLLPIVASNKTTFLYDSLGRIRLFQGVNLVTKQPPWFDPTLTNQSVIAALAAEGVNVIRLGLMWTGAEPSSGAACWRCEH